MTGISVLTRWIDVVVDKKVVCRDVEVVMAPSMGEMVNRRESVALRETAGDCGRLETVENCELHQEPRTKGFGFQGTVGLVLPEEYMMVDARLQAISFRHTSNAIKHGRMQDGQRLIVRRWCLWR